MQVLLFDIDGTLIRSGGAGKAAMESALQSAFGVSTIRDTVPYAGRTDNAICRELLAVHDLIDSIENRDRLLQEYLTHLPRTIVDRPGVVLPGVPEYIQYLQTKEKVAIGLLTGNVQQGAKIKLLHYQLWHHFPFGGFADGWEQRNDVARGAYEIACSHLQTKVHPENVWVIGDTPADVTCAQAIGAKSVAVCTGWHTRSQLESAGATIVLDDLQAAHTQLPF